MNNRIIEDGFGSRWSRCELDDCDLVVVRPGKAQCSNCDVRELRAERELLREPLRALLAAVRAARVREAASIEIDLSSELVQRLEDLAESGCLPGAEAGETDGSCPSKVIDDSETSATHNAPGRSTGEGGSAC